MKAFKLVRKVNGRTIVLFKGTKMDCIFAHQEYKFNQRVRLVEA